MKYTVDCPACSAEFEIGGVAQAESGLRCPKCNVGFVPEKVHRTKTQEELEREQQQREMRAQRDAHEAKWLEFGRLENHASTLSVIAALLVIVMFIALFFGVVSSVGDGTPSLTAFSIAGGSGSLAFTLFLIAQIYHLRAALEKLNNK